MSLILRYIDEKNQVFERFVGFLNCHDETYDNTNINEELQVNEPKLTGEKLGNIVVSILKSMSLDLENCVGIGTDGCSVMTSQLRGAVQQVQKYCVNAVHSPCSNHALNLSISKSSDVQLVRNTMGIIKEIISFFKLSSKRNFILKNNLKGCKRSITSLCETRWVERHTSIFEFQSCLSEIIDSLTDISEWTEHISSSKAKTLLMAVTCCDFIITLFALTDVLSVTLPASRLLQSYDRDIVEASDIIDGIILTLSGKRSNCESDFSQLFEQSKTLMNKLDIDLKLPRIAKRQTQRSNTSAQSPEEYYRRVLYIPLLESISENLQSRFLNAKTKTTFILMLLIPSNILNISNDKKQKLLQAVTNNYAYLNINILEFQGEIELWKTKWVESKNECKYLIYICLYNNML